MEGTGLGQALFSGCRKFFWFASAIALALDQLSKFLLAAPGARLGGPIVIIPGLFAFVQRRPNPRAAFSLGPSSALFYVIATLAGLALIGYLWANSNPSKLLPHVALGLVCGGALGNLVDRALFGAVRDFVDLHFKEIFHWPTFNLADTAICVGVGMLLLDAVLSMRLARKPSGGTAAEEELRGGANGCA